MDRTRTGAAYLSIEAAFCPPDEGGCGVLHLKSDLDVFPPTPKIKCGNCDHAPLAHVTVTTADYRVPEDGSAVILPADTGGVEYGVSEDGVFARVHPHFPIRDPETGPHSHPRGFVLTSAHLHEAHPNWRMLAIEAGVTPRAWHEREHGGQILVPYGSPEAEERRGDTDPVVVYARGIISCSVCAPAEMSVEQVESEVNAQHPTGISSPWRVSSDPTFKGGSEHPGPCDQRPTSHIHYLMEC